MKRIMILIGSLCFSQVAFSQFIQLKKGEVFTFQTTRHIESDVAYQGDTNEKDRENELLDQTIVSYEVLEVFDDHYRMKASEKIIQSSYRRSREKGAKWQTGLYVYPNLGFTLIGYPNEGGYTFDMSLDGQHYNTRHDDSTYNVIRNFSSVFFSIDKELGIGQVIWRDTSPYLILEKTDLFTVLECKTNHNDVVYRREVKVDHRGVVFENMMYLSKVDTLGLVSNPDPYFGQMRVKEKQYERVVQIKKTDQNKTSFSLKKDGVWMDTTFISTDVRVVGRVKDAQSLSLEWRDPTPLYHKEYQLKPNILVDGTFEFRLPILQLQKFKLSYHNQSVSVSLLPGDDLYLDFDEEKMFQTIEANGIGANHVNFGFDLLRFEQVRDLSFQKVTELADDPSDSSAEYFKGLVREIKEDKAAFVETYRMKIAPQVYLREFWDLRIEPFRYLELYGQIQRQKLYNGSNQSIYRSDLMKGVDSLLHPDCDLISFAEHYEDFISTYAEYQVYERIKDITGAPSSSEQYFQLRNSRLLGRYDTAYDMAGYFSGITEHVLKYVTLCRALRYDWEVFLELFERFKEEYPNSIRSKKLEEAYQKVKGVQPGQKAFDFELSNSSGDRVRLSDFKGKIVYLIFFNPESPNNNYLIEDRERLSEVLKGQNVEVVCIALDTDVEQSKRGENGASTGTTSLTASGIETRKLRDKYVFPFGSKKEMVIDTQGRVYLSEVYMKNVIEKPEIVTGANDPNWMKSEEGKTIENLQWIIAGLVGLILLMILGVVWYRSAAARRLRLAALNTQVRELELTAIRAQMNPHFLYNALNSIQNLVQQTRTEEAHSYISRFASLIRAVLKNSAKEEITLHEELQMIGEYVQLEQLRFDFDFQVSVSKDVDAYAVFLPPLLLQPIVENAIIHGLSPKQGHRKLAVAVESDEEQICITIEDNGVGREVAKQSDTSSSGKGLAFSRDRLKLLEEKYGDTYMLDISDLQDLKGEASGTCVKICFVSE